MNSTPLALALVLALPLPGQQSTPLRVCATTTDLADLARTVGGPDADVMAFCRGPEDPHFLEPKPGFLKRLSEADLLVLVGMELEQGWLPVLLESARNLRVASGGPGHVDVGRGIRPLQRPPTGADRSHGDVHALGNPHYLLDPLCGLAAAARIRDAMTALRPERKADFAARHDG